MRRCKYIYNCIVITHYGTCRIPRDIACDDYRPVELDPYWKDIVDETNRRLYNE